MEKEEKTIKYKRAVLLLSCPDQPGLVSRISHFIFERGGNILDLDEHVEAEEKVFSIRVAWEVKESLSSLEPIKEEFRPLAENFKAQWEIRFADKALNLALFVSKTDHCLQEILWRHSLGEFPANISLVISNHNDLGDLAKHHGVPFHCFPITKEDKEAQEEEELALLDEHQVDTVVLARYMQILSPQFVGRYPQRIINIHHSFLPAFAGGDPYKQAYQRGVKIIGATSHYVTEELDEGPIIEQDIIRITHKDSIKDLIRKGRDLERLVLARALHYHCEHRVLTRGGKTLVFD